MKQPVTTDGLRVVPREFGGLWGNDMGMIPPNPPLTLEEFNRNAVQKAAYREFGGTRGCHRMISSPRFENTEKTLAIQDAVLDREIARLEKRIQEMDDELFNLKIGVGSPPDPIEFTI